MHVTAPQLCSTAQLFILQTDRLAECICVSTCMPVGVCVCIHVCCAHLPTTKHVAVAVFMRSCLCGCVLTGFCDHMPFPQTFQPLLVPLLRRHHHRRPLSCPSLTQPPAGSKQGTVLAALAYPAPGSGTSRKERVGEDVDQTQQHHRHGFCLEV